MDEPAPQVETSPAESPSGQPKKDLRWVFAGANGLRAGWGALLFALLVFVFEFLISRLLRHFLPGQRGPELPLLRSLIGTAFQLAGIFAATAIIARIEHRAVFAYGYQGASRTVRFLFGLVCGFISISVLMAVLWKAGLLAFDGQALHGGAIWEYAGGWGLMFVIVAFLEETTLRGYLQYTLTRGIGFWWAALLLSLLFGLMHGRNPGESPVGLFSAAAFGLLACLSLWYSGSLWWIVGFHAAWDWGESYFYGTSDSGLVAKGHLLGEHPLGSLLWSGGPTGPEGSLWTLPLLAAVTLLIWLWWGRQGVTAFRGQAWKPCPRIAAEPKNT